MRTSRHATQDAPLSYPFFPGYAITFISKIYPLTGRNYLARRDGPQFRCKPGNPSDKVGKTGRTTSLRKEGGPQSLPRRCPGPLVPPGPFHHTIQGKGKDNAKPQAYEILPPSGTERSLVVRPPPLFFLLMKTHSTTVLTVRHKGVVAIGGDGQVTVGNTIMKADAVKIRRLNEQTRSSPASPGPAPTPSPCWSASRPSSRTIPANMPRAATELAKEWRTDRALRRLEAMLAVVDARHTLLVTGNGDVIQPTDGVLGIGSGGSYAVAAARALLKPIRSRRARDRPRGPGDRRGHRHLHEHQHHGGGTCRARVDPAGNRRPSWTGTSSARTRPSGPWPWPSATAGGGSSFPTEMRQEVAPKNIMMIGPTGVGKTEIARRLAKLTGAPFIKVEATRYTEVGYYGRDVESMVRELVENAIGLVRQKEREKVREEAQRRAEERLLGSAGPDAAGAATPTTDGPESPERYQRTREKMRAHAGRRRDGRAPRGADRRAEGRADDVHRHGHGADGRRFAGDVREDRAAEHRRGGR